MRPDDVRFGSKADICGATRHVRFTPNSDRKSEIPQKAMSALLPKADMCSATSDVCFGPIADMNLSRTELLQRWNYRFCITNLALKVQELLDRISVEVFDLDQPHWNVALRASRMPNLFSRNMFQMTV
jgi:hypothetical protein